MSRKTWIALGAVVALIAGGAWYFLGDSSNSVAAQAGGNDTITDQDMTMGDPKAKVVLIEYAAPMCPHCAHFNNEIMPDIKKSYIDTGKVLYVFRVYPLGAPDGVAEKLARCMPKAKYFPFMDQLFRNHQQWNPQFGVQDVRGALLQQARTAGMSEGQFDACIADTKQDAIINKVAEDGMARYKITGTPTVIIDGKVVTPGMVPSLEQLRGALDAALAAAP
jgi:protein-disulfide isomerase